jgi:8-oxo-dGTP diphosphatase
MLTPKNIQKPNNNLNTSFYTQLLTSAKQEGIKRFSTGALIFEGKKVLLFRRAKNDFLGGIYEVPGGSLEEGESLKECLQREIEEETGLSIKRVIRYVDYFDYLSEEGKKTRQFNFAIEVKTPRNVKLSSEHDHFVWITPDTLQQINPTESISITLHNFWKG